MTKAGDSGPDIWADVNDVTIQWSFFYASLHPTTVSATTGANMVRQRISMHHNVYAVNGERNPQLRGDVRTFDYVNNVVYGWGSMPQSNVNSGYGIMVRNEPGEPQVNGLNVVNNAFVAIPNLYPAWGLVYGDKPGADLTTADRRSSCSRARCTPAAAWATSGSRATSCPRPTRITTRP